MGWQIPGLGTLRTELGLGSSGKAAELHLCVAVWFARFVLH